MTALAVLFVLVFASAASAQHAHEGAGSTEVLIRQTEVSPRVLTVLAGETVTWRNVAFRQHTITSRDGRFDARLSTGQRLAHTFAQPGDYAYFCRIHPTITGTVLARAAVLAGPTGVVVRGERFALTGRVAPGSGPVTIDGGASPVFATPDAAGNFQAEAVATADTTFRLAGADAVTVRVVGRRSVIVKRLRGRLHVRVHPPAPRGVVVLQLRLRDRFGWWPVQRARLDQHSHAHLRVPRRRGPLRVVFTLEDGATVLARTSLPRRG